MNSESRIKTNELFPVLLLTILIWFVYGQVSHYEFVTFDDPQYVYENPHIVSGITWENIQWALTNVRHMCWQPLTWLSHMLDVQLFGLNPGLHHWSNLVLHLVNTVLLFLLFRSMTGATRESFFLSALFAVHPLGVDTVAWISERKNLLATLFSLLSIFGYWRYADSGKYRYYAGSFLAFVAGLLSKPSVVTLPFLFLLLDFWPIRRIDISAISWGQAKLIHKWLCSKLMIEKLPFFITTLAYLMIFTFSLNIMYQGMPLQTPSLELRIANALLSYIMYLKDMIWPNALAVYYPFPAAISLKEAVVAAIMLVGITICLAVNARKHPYAIVGWLWFMGMLVPAIGIVQAGLWPARADRWMYFPMIGILVLAVWGGDRLLSFLTRSPWVRTALLLSVLVTLGTTARLQASHWRDSIALYEQAITVTSDNYVAHDNLGLALAMKGKLDAAYEQFQKALAIQPAFWKSHQNIGAIYLLRGQHEAALYHFETALEKQPNSPRLHNNVGRIKLAQKHYDEAAASFRQTLAIRPGDAKALAYLKRIEEIARMNGHWMDDPPIRIQR